MDGIQLLEELKKIQPSLVVIMITGYATIKSAVEAIQKGPMTTFPSLYAGRGEGDHREGRGAQPSGGGEHSAPPSITKPAAFRNIIGNSPALHRVFEMIDKIAGGDSTILLTGETGTGKELVPRPSMTGAAGGRSSSCPSTAALCQRDLESELFGHMKGAFTGAVGTAKA